MVHSSYSTPWFILRMYLRRLRISLFVAKDCDYQKNLKYDQIRVIIQRCHVNATSATSGTGTAYTSGAHEFTLDS